MQRECPDQTGRKKTLGPPRTERAQAFHTRAALRICTTAQTQQGGPDGTAPAALKSHSPLRKTRLSFTFAIAYFVAAPSPPAAGAAGAAAPASAAGARAFMA